MRGLRSSMHMQERVRNKRTRAAMQGKCARLVGREVQARVRVRGGGEELDTRLQPFMIQADGGSYFPS
jgi:hypothetical protein